MRHDGSVLTNGTLTSAGQTARTLQMPTVNAAQHDLLRVSLANAVNATSGTEQRGLLRSDGQSPLLVTSGSAWRHLDTGGDAGTTWRQLNYNDSTGPAARPNSASETAMRLLPSAAWDERSTGHHLFLPETFVVELAGLQISRCGFCVDDGGVVYLERTGRGAVRTFRRRRPPSLTRPWQP
jgi:hypothetical protein